ncbi:hypothetical protein C6499_16865 [Candidatus Poribacteria bacterium]|nr:MAG: hypothetical protein C6499_16865 [Candidatus Poribacteria bacterium]
MHNIQTSALLCIPDTNSLIHMRDIEVINDDLRLWLWKEFDVKLSKTICDEIQSHQILAKGNIQKQCNRSKWSFQVPIDKLEKAFLQSFYPNLDNRGDRGERHNCCVALEAVLSGKYRQVIFLTDELKTTDSKQDGFLFQVFDTFRIGKIWSSLDFVLYLFTRHWNRFRFQIAEGVLRDINSRLGGQRGIPTKRFECYHSKLKEINKTLSQLPAYPKTRS